METNSTPRKIVAWTILLSLLNPGFMIPDALAADTDVYTSVQTTANQAAPNILIILDTGDPMNVPEPWHEYPGPYDSHVEYLWNDATFLAAITLDMSVPFLWPTTEYGNWGGQSLAGSCASAQGCQESTLPADRTALKNNALAYAAATPISTDPDFADIAMVNGGTPASNYAAAGGRKYWRNYGGGRAARNDGLQDARLVYWIPAQAGDQTSAAPPSDFRLLAPSLNKWYGNLARLQGALPRGGITWGGAVNDPLDQSPNAATEASPAQTAYNQCKDSVIGQVTPTMVSNNGGVGQVTNNDPGATTAWNAFNTSAPVAAVPMGLVPSTAYAPSSVARNSGRYLGAQWQRWERYGGTTLQNSAGNPSGPGSYPATAPTAGSTGTIGAGSTVGTVGATNVAAKGDFLGSAVAAQAGPPAATYPVRDSYNTATPFGTNSTPGTWGMPIRTQAAGNNSGWTSMKSDYGGYLFGEVTTSAYYVNLSYLATMLSLYQTKWNPSGSGTTVTAANVQWLAFMGNRDDASPTFGKVVGLEDYYDTGPSGLTLNVGSASVICTRTCGVSPAATTAKAPATDANSQAHTWSPTGGSNAAVCVSTGTSGSNCSTLPGACAANPSAGLNQYYTEIPNSCGWTGRSSVYVQGVGTWWYGGTCTGNCTGPGAVAGAAPCPGGANPNTANCSISGTSSPTVDGNVLTNAILNPANTTTTGCAAVGNTLQTCTARETGGTGWPGVTGATGCIYNPTCASTTQTSGGATPQYYFVYPYVTQETLLYHDCVSDDPNFANLNSSSGYMYGAGRTFGTSWATTVGSTLTAPYNTTKANGVQSTAQAVDMYSINYLNWYYGPKSNGNPIGRKTRLQIAKDALVTLVQTTNDVNFGLMNYNLTSNDGSFTDIGAHVAFSITPMGTTNTSDPLYSSSAPNIPNYTVTNRNAIIAAINAIVAGSRSPVTEALYEAYLYFRGEAPWGGQLTNCGTPSVTRGGSPTVTVGTGSTCGGAAGSVTAGAYISNALPINNGNDNAGTNSGIPAVCTSAQVTSQQCAAGSMGTKYASPMMSDPNPPTVGAGPALCQKNFVLFVTEGQAESDGFADSVIEPLTQTINGTVFSMQQGTGGVVSPNYAQFTTTGQTTGTYCANASGPYCNTDQAGAYQDPASAGYIWFDELAYYMSVADMNTSASLTGVQPVITYTIAFGGQTSPVIQNAAQVSGGIYATAQSSQQLASALQQALTSIVAWHPSSSTPAVPISSQNRAQSSTDVYLAFFGPSSNPNWPGTVKKYHLDTTPADCLDDQGNDPAVCLVGQTLLPPQNSYNIEHTTTDASGNKLVIVNPLAESFWATVQDGGNANMGGTGYQLLVNSNPGTPAARNMYTYVSAAPGTNSNDLTVASNAFVDTNTNITPAAMGVSAPVEQQLINWARGGDVTQTVCQGASSACNVWAAWPHAAVLHSVPAVLTYDSTTTPAVQTVFYVSTEGVLHAVGAVDGHELWSFIIEEAFPQLNTLMLNYAGGPIQVADGSPALFTKTDGAGHVTTAYLYFGQRRGGNAYYALDVTQRLQPKLLWKINNTCSFTGGNPTCNASPYTQLGQTWSTPAVVNVAANSGNPTLVVGGGYDPNEDNVNPTNPSDTMGKAIYFIHGVTAAMLAGFTSTQVPSMTCAIPSNPAALNMDNNAQGYVNRVYIGDMCAHLFRVDTAATSAGSWQASLLSDLSVVNSTYATKIFFPPVVVREGPSQAFGQRFDAVYVGTGDHENPLAHTTPPTNHMFMIKDFATGFTPMASPAAANSLWDITAAAYVGENLSGAQIASFTAAPGWQFDFAAPGEKLSASPEVIGNILNFGTYSPTQSLNTCLPPGLGQLYGINAITGGTVNTQLTAGYVVTGTTPKTYAGMNGRGYVAPGGIIVLGGQVYRITIVDGALHTIPAGSLSQSRSYWQKEPQF